MNSARSIRNGMPLGGLVLALLLLGSCRLSDHSEGANEVTPEDITFTTSGHEQVDPDRLPAIAFDSLRRDMGLIVQGAKVTKRFQFTNTGGAPLVITNVHSVCGCTVGKDWPKEPIAPGEGGSIEVVFDSEGRSGRQEKTVTVVTNATPPSTVLALTGRRMNFLLEPNEP
jgi:hypothetical protein